nr:AAA family ATPase [uncultured Pseudoxanthomonas sp.]
MSIIQHPHYLAPRQRLLEAFDRYRPGHVIIIIGPSGVGKTTLRHSAMREAFGRPASWGVGRIPVVEAIARLPSDGYFSSKALAISLIDELRAPRLQWLEERPDRKHIAEIADAQAWWDAHLGLRITEANAWRLLQRLLGARHCKFVSIDQANGLLKDRANKSPTDHMLHLMSFAEDAGIMLILTGVPEVVRLWLIHSELRRRVDVVWVPPYSEARNDDRQNFATLIRSLASRYALCDAKVLLGMDADLMAASGGVIDELIRLLERAVSLAEAEKARRVTRQHLERCFYADHDLEALWKDIRMFENAMKPGSVRERVRQIREMWE